MSRVLAVLITSCILTTGLVAPSDVPAFVAIYADSTMGPVPPRVMGFICGKDEQGAYLNDSLVTGLRPRNWRLDKIAAYNYISQLELDLRITYSASFSYAWAQGGYDQAKPWLDWAGYEQFIATYLDYVSSSYPDAQPEFYDVWNEPDLPYFWTGTRAQLLELFARTYAVVKAHDPEMKVVGPSVARYERGHFGVRDVVAFLSDLDETYDVRLEAIAWHENESGTFGSDLPEEILTHETQIRADLADAFPPEYQPELHVNEFTGGNVHLSPGYNVGYLYYLTESTVDAANRSCWYVYEDVPGPDPVWCDCWAGLAGMFTRDGLLPTHAYWVYRTYADMLGGDLLETRSFQSTTNVIAARDDGSETLRILAGRYHHYSTADVTLRVVGYPYDHNAVTVRVGRIPHYPEMFEQPNPRLDPLPDGPVDNWEVSLVVERGFFDIPLDDFADNDAYVVLITEDELASVASEMIPSTEPLGPAVAVPNPFRSRTEISFRLPAPAQVELSVYDLKGRLVTSLLDGPSDGGGHHVPWDGRDRAGAEVAPGVYFLRLEASGESALSRVVLVR